MANLFTVFRKELADHLGSKRYLLLFAIVIALSTMFAYQGATAIKSNLGQGYMGYTSSFTAIFTSAQSTFSFTYFMMVFGPIIGLALGFDAISKERTSGSLSVLLCQPIFRDSVINGKFLASLAAVALIVTGTVGIMVGVAIPIIGFGPTMSETLGIVVFTFLTILYVSFWLALSLLFSTLFKKTTTSTLAVISSWILFVFAIGIIAGLLVTVLVPAQMPSYTSPPKMGGSSPGPQIYMPDQSQSQAYQRAMELRVSLMNGINSISPSYLYTQATNMLLSSGNIRYYSSAFGGGFMPPTQTQTVADTWPYITAIAGAMVICFIAAYVIFLRREIRPGS